jgi:hypothetical protein
MAQGQATVIAELDCSADECLQKQCLLFWPVKLVRRLNAVLKCLARSFCKTDGKVKQLSSLFFGSFAAGQRLLSAYDRAAAMFVILCIIVCAVSGTNLDVFFWSSCMCSLVSHGL